jgi:Flp pilus assembly protein TadG
MVIETAIVVPVLALLSVGAFQLSMVVARQSELQSAAQVAEAMVLASNPDTEAEMITLKQVIVETARLNPDQVSLTKVYRCDSDAAYVSGGNRCADEAEISTFVRVTMTDTYTPPWTQLGFGQPLNYRVARTVQVS